MSDPYEYQRYQDPFEMVELQRNEYRRRQEIEASEIDLVKSTGRYEQFMDHARRRLVMEMRMDIYGKRHPKEHVVRYPADWWEAVKERFAPAWFRDRYPVRFVEVTASLLETYPDIQPAIPDRRPVMHFAVKRNIQFPIW